jgi:hypothetical protein
MLEDVVGYNVGLVALSLGDCALTDLRNYALNKLKLPPQVVVNLPNLFGNMIIG